MLEIVILYGGDCHTTGKMPVVRSDTRLGIGDCENGGYRIINLVYDGSIIAQMVWKQLTREFTEIRVKRLNPR